MGPSAGTAAQGLGLERKPGCLGNGHQTSFPWGGNGVPGTAAERAL